MRRAIPNLLQGILVPAHLFTLPSPLTSFHFPFDSLALNLPHHLLPTPFTLTSHPWSSIVLISKILQHGCSLMATLSKRSTQPFRATSPSAP
ncbi:hypothetical protein CROQUDRAFT_678455 [Cronartium quercuum f. sp. fusiforme G11]|uniref:Uncharacterized protein n=1 Tax=Cronartium quercuum f. sp. fusiforme G11 TaxID=708437 RepID=A0A9P6T9C5_9BASI|nr:hypothetical protein CROQUDRAFT_678455 [Cronartium quercuum f. sp. fusiforme G11]